jgi:hypothetical protein
MLNLFCQPKYTIDTSSLLAILNPREKYEKKTFQRLWDDICKLCKAGKLISHIEVFKEIKEGGIKDQILWAKSYKYIFQKYNLPGEGKKIQDIGRMGPDFVFFLEQGKQKSTHADPWLIAQAKINNLILINEEEPRKSSIPMVCRALGIRSINLLGLMNEEQWIY